LLNKRTWLLVLLYGLGLLGMIYWYAFGVKSIVKEITSVSV
jgi:hypothetical protein